MQIESFSIFRESKKAQLDIKKQSLREYWDLVQSIREITPSILNRIKFFFIVDWENIEVDIYRFFKEKGLRDISHIDSFIENYLDKIKSKKKTDSNFDILETFINLMTNSKTTDLDETIDILGHTFLKSKEDLETILTIPWSYEENEVISLTKSKSKIKNPNFLNLSIGKISTNPLSEKSEIKEGVNHLRISDTLLFFNKPIRGVSWLVQEKRERLAKEIFGIDNISFYYPLMNNLPLNNEERKLYYGNFFVFPEELIEAAVEGTRQSVFNFSNFIKNGQLPQVGVCVIKHKDFFTAKNPQLKDIGWKLKFKIH